MYKKKRRDVEKERQWRDRLERQKRSGLSVPLFCATEGVSQHLFWRWRREIKSRDAENFCAPKRKRTETEVSSKAPTVREKTEFVEFVPVSLVEAKVESSNLPVVQNRIDPIEIASPCGLVVRVPAHVDPGALRLVLATLRRSSC